MREKNKQKKIFLILEKNIRQKLHNGIMKKQLMFFT